jgi:two-component system sensor histidine kinase/response regulator
MGDASSPSDQAGNVLLVDDQPANLAVLSKLLAGAGYKVRAVSSGERALEAARLALPDCMLLDVAMPGMDGYATCAAFRADAALANVPIIFLTAFDDAAHKVQAFQAGGRDYVSKPFQVEEVLARVGSQMLVSRLERELHHQNAHLVDANAKLTEINDIKARITAMLVHDVRSPLSVIASVLDDPVNEEALTDAREAYRKINAMLTEMLELYRSEQAPAPAPGTRVDLISTLESVISASRHLATAKGVDLDYLPPTQPVIVLGDRRKLDRVFSNLFDNAIKFTPSGGLVRVTVGFEDGGGVEAGLRFVVVTTTDTGPGIPATELPYVFDPYRQGASARQRGGFGLGLSIVRHMVAEHFGRVHVHSQVGVGTEFHVFLPL